MLTSLRRKRFSSSLLLLCVFLRSSFGCCAFQVATTTITTTRRTFGTRIRNQIQQQEQQQPCRSALLAKSKLGFLQWKNNPVMRHSKMSLAMATTSSTTTTATTTSNNNNSSTSSSNNNDDDVASQTQPQPSMVNICTAELCKCQEGIGALDILQDLQSRNLPYPIDETPCLGACGGGAMVAIDFEDGSSILVSGLEETLNELGLEGSESIQQQESTTEQGVQAQAEVQTTLENEMKQMQSTDVMSTVEQSSLSSKASSSMTMNPSNMATQSKSVSTTTTASTSSKTKLVPTKMESPTSLGTERTLDYHGARERMRAEAQRQRDQQRNDDDTTSSFNNPWWNAASYLAQKATESIFSKK